MIKIKGLKKKYRGMREPILNGVDLTLPDKGFVFLYGASGAGKTTLLNCLGGLLSHKGEIERDDFDHKESFDEYRARKISFVFQNFLLEGKKSVLENVKAPLVLLGVDGNEADERALRALEMVGLKREYRRFGEDLSTGQKQRVSIARAIVKKPSLLIADEPTGNLDDKSAREVMHILKSISSSTLVVMVTHDLALVQEYGDEAYEIRDGQALKSDFQFEKADIEDTDMLEDSGLSANRKRKRKMEFSWPKIKGKRDKSGMAITAILSCASALLIGACANMLLNSRRDLEGFSANKNMIYLHSLTKSRLSENHLVELYSNPEAEIISSAPLSLAYRVCPNLDYRNFSACHDPIGENVSTNFSIPFFFVDYDGIKGLWTAESEKELEAGSCFLDYSIISSLNGTYERTSDFLDSEFTLLEEHPDGLTESVSFSISGFLDTGLPLVAIASGSEEINYRFRNGNSFAFGSTFSDIEFVDYDDLPSGMSIEKYDEASEDEVINSDNGGVRCYVTDAAGVYLSKTDLSFLNLSLSPISRLKVADNPEKIAIAIRDYASEEFAIPSKQRLLENILGAYLDSGYFKAYGGENVISGSVPQKEGELLIPKWMVDLFGESLLISSLGEEGYEISGYQDSSMEPLCVGSEEYFHALLPKVEPMINFSRESSLFESAPRFLSGNPAKTIRFIEENFDGAYESGNLLNDFESYSFRSAMDDSKVYLYVAVACLLMTLFIIIMLTISDLSRERYRLGLWRCLGKGKGFLFAETLLSRFSFISLFSLLPAILSLALFAIVSAMALEWWLVMTYLLALLILPLLACALPLLYLLGKEPAQLVKDLE